MRRVNPSGGEKLIRSLGSILIRFEVRLIPLGANDSLMSRLQRERAKKWNKINSNSLARANLNSILLIRKNRFHNMELHSFVSM